MIVKPSLSLLLFVSFPVICAGQATPPAAPTVPPPAPTVYSNPRAPHDDPRMGLKPGLYDAGEAAFGLERLTSLPKPDGFSAEDNATATTAAPPPPPAAAAPADGAAAPAEGAAAGRGGRGGRGGGRGGAGRGPQLPVMATGSTNSDLAFSGNHLFVGNYNGINIYDIDNPKQIKLRTSLVCPGGQGDVSVYGHLLFMSAEAMNGRIDCGTQGIPLPAGYVPPPPPPPPPPAADGAPAAAGGGRGRACRRPARTVSAACASSTSATLRIPSRWPPCRAAAVRTRTRW